MESGAKTKTFVIATIAVLALALWWWLGRESETVSDDDSTSAAASAQAEGTSDSPKLAVPLRRSDVDPFQAPRATVSGTVRDERGQPIAGAQVCAKLEDDDLAQTDRFPPQCTTTREDGTYRIEGLLGAEHNLHASARGYLPERYQSRSGLQQRLSPRMDLQAGSTRAGIDFVLKAGGVEVTGVVKDISGGEIEGAWVSAGAGWWGSDGATFTRSDEEGRFSLWVEPPDVNVSAHADGYARGSRGASIPGTFVELFLTPESVVVGKVVWADSGKPVAGARIAASGGSGAFFLGFGGGGPGSVHSEDDGSFRLEGLQPGSYKLRVSDDELVGMADEKIHVGLGQTSDPVIVKVHPAFAIRGTVLLDGETPCSQGRVSLQGKERKDDSYGGGGEEDGTVLVKGVLPGTYEVTVTCNDFVAEDSYPDIVVADASIEGLSWSVHRGQSIRGVVLDAEGKPVEGARVSARGKATTDPRARLGRGRGERSEPDGSFLVDGLLPGTYELSASHDEQPSPHEPLEVVVPEGSDVTDITLTMLAHGEIRGIVRDEKGTPVAGVSIDTDGPGWNRASTNDEGRFVLTGVEVGEHRVSAQRGWTDTMRAPGASDDDEAGERVTVRSGEVTEVELVVESQNGRITGQVLGEGGEPIADAFVEAVRESDSAAKAEGGGRGRARWGSWSRQPVLTDDDGRFELDDLAEQGVYSIYANRKGGGEALAEHVAAGSDVTLEIAETSVLAGVVRIEGGGVPRRFQISARDRKSGIYEGDSFLHTDGQWRLANLPPGTYEVSVDASEGNAKVEGIELSEGGENTDIELVLVPRVELRGTLVDAETGEPVAGLKVSAASDGGGIRFRGDMGKANQPDVSDTEGKFVVENAPTGLVRIMIMAPGFTDNDYGWNWLTRRVAPEPKVQELGKIELLKDRKDRGEESGDLGFKTKDSEPGTEPEDVRHVVAFVRPGSPAAQAGLKVGDEITTIDGQDVVGLQSYRYGKLTNVRPGTKLVVGVVDGEAERQIPITAGPPV
ncbi:carboxypeptidase regulatory-like domain-containing protein [Paraliomyxa miuraensis]|uniref:carboxypeptidase regulatory-like domain-containing protein n=1 Tax=Paraliomyxa miuraensis TaxID=376150 RepID=UPI0022548039|nr:carboxypeptidase regulatory-like domain-containing protein [Paraliomyxa miuraensis]MCX4247110.1 carboxypeptidase regulatory-like domain-containing protein [Paraliomyxa miuraensis]